MHLFGNSELKLELLLVLGPADNDPSWSLAVTRPENKGVSLLTNIPIVKLREREGQGVDPGRSLKGHL